MTQKLKKVWLVGPIFVVVVAMMFIFTARAETWSLKTSGTGQNLNSIFFVNNTIGWAAGDSGTIRKTTNRGETWTGQTSGTGNALESVFFVTPNLGWVAGGSGTVLKTTDGGTTWADQSSGTGNRIKEIYFQSATRGSFLEDNGTIRKTTDGGSTWTVQVADNSRNMNSFYFVSQNNGWAVGENGTIRATTNGGDSWTDQNSGTTNAFHAVYFLSATHGWAVGDSGTIRRTTNGGSTWISATSGIGEQLNDIHFVDAKTGWVVGNSGVILKTTDGGTSWSAEVSGTSENLNNIYFHQKHFGCAVGGSGVILCAVRAFDFSLSNGGLVVVEQGQTVSNAITATLESGATQAVSFSVSGLPTDTTASFSSASCSPTCSTVLNISTATSTPAGDYTITVTVTGGGVTKTTSFTLTVNAISFDFALSDDGAKSVTAGESVTSTITASLVAGTTQSVSFSVSGLPTSTAASFSSASCSPTCSTTLTISTNSSAPEGNHIIVVSAVGGEVTKTTSFALAINAAPPAFDFTLSDLGNRSATAGQTIQNSITATLASGSSTSVTFSASGLPTGATASFSPASCTLNCTSALSIVTPVTAHGADYVITVSATGGSITKTTAFTIALAESSTQTSENTVPIDLGGEVALATPENNQIVLMVPSGAVTPDGATDLQLIVSVVQQEESIYVAPPGDNDYTLGLFDVNIIKKTILDGVVISTSSITSFNSPITLRFSWVESTLPAGVSETGQEFGWWDVSNVWHDLTDISTWDFEDNHVTYTTDHLTRFALVAAASATTSPPPAPTTVSLPRTSFFVWELQEGALVGLRPGCNESADLNSDGRVNLIDFSVMAYWRNRGNAPSNLDINGDGKVDVADLSILIYCWVR